MDEIRWIENVSCKKLCKVDTDTEVRVSIVKKGNVYNSKFIFYNDAEQKISHSGYMVSGVASDKIYFREEFLQKGYKIQRVGNGHPFICIPAMLKSFEGLYKLIFDVNMKYWYIRRAEEVQ